MWLPFILETFHFALNFFASVVSFAVFWLYLEGWRVRRNADEWPLLIGYALLALSFLIHATSIEDVLLQESVLEQITPQLPLILFASTHSLAFILIMVGLLLDPLPQRPQHGEATNWWKRPLVTSKPRAFLMSGGLSLSLLVGIKIGLPLLAGIIAWLYWRRATTGLERHLKPIGRAFFVLAVSELLGLADLWRQGPTVSLSALTAPFGPLWLMEHILLGVAVALLAQWVWQYLLKRFFSQLFIIFTAFTVVTFLLMTLVFTGMLLHNMRQSALHQLAIDTRVLTLALLSKEEELLSDVTAFTQQSDVEEALTERTPAVLQEAAEQFLLATAESSLAIVTADGEVVAQAEDASVVGTSLSDNPLVKAALTGERVVSATAATGVIAPALHVTAAAPIRQGGEIRGAALLATHLDTAFVDGVKAATGLEAGIYSGSVLSATTLTAADGTSRWIGITEDNSAVTEAVLERGEEYTGTVTVLHAPYFAAYQPLRNRAGEIIGMLFTGQPQLALWQTLGQSIELTYLLVALLGIGSLVPAFFVARYIAFQVR